ncbi:MAG: hypothetical protein WBA13_09610 [Microcoleaceae cyanobacterium]
MDILSLSVLLGMIALSDEVLNGRLKLSQRLLAYMDQMGSQNKDRQNNSTRSS